MVSLALTDPAWQQQVSTFHRELADWARKVDRLGGERALISAGRRARTAIVREMAQVKDTTQKPIRRRVQSYLIRKPERSYVRIWIGLKHSLRVSEISSRAVAGLMQQPGVFAIYRSGANGRRRRASAVRTGDATLLRRNGGRLSAVGLELAPEAESVLRKHAREVYQRWLPLELARQANLLARRGFQRSKNRR